MDDWTGSSQQRKRLPPDAGLFNTRRETPQRSKFRVERGTPCLIKRAGDRQWVQFQTRKVNEFDSAYTKTGRSHIFFCNGWLLCVSKELVRIH